MPIKGNKYYNFYKNFLLKNKNKVKAIYLNIRISRKAITDYLELDVTI